MGKVKNIAKAAAGAAAAAAALTAAGSYYFYKLAVPAKSKLKIHGQGKTPDEQAALDARDAKYKAWLAEQKTEDWYIESVDKLKLHATFIPSETPSDKVVILVHGYRSTSLWDFGEMLPYYKKMNVNIVMPDNRGHGTSEGKYIGFGFQDHYDIERWIYHTITALGKDSRIYLHGVSMGAAIVMLCAGDPLPPQVKGIIEDCGYSSLNAEMDYCMHHYYKLPVEPFRSEVEFLTKHTAGYQFDDCDCLAALEKAEVPMLFIHGTADEFVPKDMMLDCYNACASPRKDLMFFEGAGHAESMLSDPEKYNETVQKFIKETEQSGEQ